MIGGDVTKKVTQGENVHYIIKRHPIGLVPVYMFVLVGTLVTLIVFGGMMGGDQEGLVNIPDSILGVTLLLVIGFVFVAGMIGRQIYWANELLVTDENVIQILRPSLLSRQVAQLNLGKIQDVSVAQKGIFQMSFKYGTIVIETAGEVASYKFTYAPNPNELAAKIILAHDEYIAKHGITKEFMGSP